MQIYLNRVDGIDDAIISMFLSKRTLTRELEQNIRRVCRENQDLTCANSEVLGALNPEISIEMNDWLNKVFKWGKHHVTMLRFLDFSFTVYGMHRGAQDDFDSHAKRMDNRIIRSSTRLASYDHGEVSEYYEDKIIPTDVALAYMGIATPDEIEYEGRTYVRGVNGYIVKGMEHLNDVKRGLYMLSIPSNFIFRCNGTEFAHIYKERNAKGTAAPELKTAVESMADQIEDSTNGFMNRDLLMAIKN